MAIKKEIELAESYIDNAKIADSEKTILRDYLMSCRLGEGCKPKSDRTIKSEQMALVKFGEYVNKPFREVQKEDIRTYIYELRKRELKPTSISLYSINIRQFYIWLDNGEHTYKIDWIKAIKSTKKKLDQTKLYNEDEIKRLVSVADNYRDKALVIGLYESACRLSEFMGIRIKDISFDSNGCVIRVSGKTGERIIPIIDSEPYLRNWINVHPFKDNPESPVFISFASNHYGEQLQNPNIGKLLRTYAKRAKINKYLHPHLLRHSRLTSLAQEHNFNEMDLRLYAGWSNTSEMANVYVHNNIQTIYNKLLVSKGIINDNSKELELRKNRLKPIYCPRCERKNPSEAKYCNCGTCLDVKEAMQQEDIKKEATNQAITELMEIISNPERLKNFNKFKEDFLSQEEKKIHP